MELSKCCNAEIKYSRGGQISYCSQCKNQLYPKPIITTTMPKQDLLSSCCDTLITNIQGHEHESWYTCNTCHSRCEVYVKTNPTPKQDGQTIELFRTALMEKHSDDWDMETISESAHICAATIEAYCEARCTERERLARIDEWNHIELYPFKIVYVRDDRTVIEAQERIDELQKQSSSQEGE